MRVTRRVVLERLSWAAGASAAWVWRASRGAEPNRLDVKDPAAVAQGYVENVSQVDAKKFPQFVAGSTCENCLLLQGSAGSHYRPCSLFPGKLVSISGWCKGWTPEI
jgi:hypothetical protein